MTNLEKMIDGKTPLEAAKMVEDFYSMRCPNCPLRCLNLGGNGFCAEQSIYLSCAEKKEKYLNQPIKTKKVTRFSQIENPDDFYNAHAEYEKQMKTLSKDYAVNRIEFAKWLFEEIEVEDE